MHPGMCRGGGGGGGLDLRTPTSSDEVASLTPAAVATPGEDMPVREYLTFTLVLRSRAQKNNQPNIL